MTQLLSTTDLHGYAIAATDGAIGHVDQLYFDDERWAVRHIVVDTGKWLPGRRVLLSPASVERIDREGRKIHVALTRDKVKHSPDIDTERPVSRQHEAILSEYYGYGPYWGGEGLWGAGYFPASLIAHTLPASAAFAPPPVPTPGDHSGDSHLRSTQAVSGYHVQASDGEIGHVERFLIDPDTWVIRQLVVDTSNWPGGQRVLVAPADVRSVDWNDSKVLVNRTVDQIRNGPIYDGVD